MPPVPLLPDRFGNQQGNRLEPHLGSQLFPRASPDAIRR